MNSFSKEIIFGNRCIALDKPVYFVADIAANHDGDLERAKDLIYLAAEAGADAAKFQNFKADKIVSDYGFKALGKALSHQSKWKKTVFEIYQEASISEDWTEVLARECAKAGIDYATSPYDFGAVDHVCDFVAFYKIGSGDITWLDICRHIASKGKPVFLATGASELEDITRALQVISPLNRDIVLMQCNTNYTGSKDNFRYVNLNVLKTFAFHFPNTVLGFSDHTPGHTAVLGAVALGARVIEKHFTDNTSRVGPDHAFSLTPQIWSEMVDRTRELEFALGDGVKRIEANEEETSCVQRRCLRASRNIAAGECLAAEDFEALRPAPLGSLMPYELDDIIGKKLKSKLQHGEHITHNHY